MYLAILVYVFNFLTNKYTIAEKKMKTTTNLILFLEPEINAVQNAIVIQNYLLNM